jgi:hypothetical protein
MSVNFSSSIHLNVIFFKKKVLHALTVQNKKIVAIASLALAFLATCYFAASYYFRAKKTLAPLDEEEKVFIQKDAQVEEDHPVKPTYPIENIPVDIWYKIISYSQQGMASVCKTFKDIQDKPHIIALLFEAHAHRLPPIIKQMLNQEVGRYVKHLTLKNSADLQLVITTCPNCETLDLHNIDMTDADLKHLADRFVHLKSLNLSGCKRITDQGLKHLQALTSLQSLNLYECNQMTDQGLAHLQALTSLQSLNLSWCKQITDQGLVHLQALTSLQSLGLSWCEKITDQGLKHLQALASLQSLDLSCCNQITDQGLKHLQALVCLQSLNLSWCKQITDQGLAHLQALISLQAVYLYACNQITDQGLAHLQALSSLKINKYAMCEFLWFASLEMGPLPHLK